VAGCELPPISGIATQLVATLSEDQVDITYLRDLIAQDPILTAAVLRWANSPIYGAARRVNTLDAAISILGLSRVRARTVAFFITNAFDPPRGMERETFWTSCMHSAGYAMWLGVAAGLNESEAWLTAMMVRLGELVIGHIDPDTVLALESPTSPTLPVQQRWQQERARIGFDEGEVMAEVTRLWFFPDAMVEALQKCANPLSSLVFSPLAGVVHLAALLADQETVDADSLETLPAELLLALGLQTEWMAQHIPDRASFTELKN
jgi:HD-like signal output (HDOD) protein